MIVLIVIAAVIATAISYQLKTGNSLVWWDGWHTRENNPVLFWSYLIPEFIVLAAALWMLLSEVGRAA